MKRLLISILLLLPLVQLNAGSHHENEAGFSSVNRYNALPKY